MATKTKTEDVNIETKTENVKEDRVEVFIPRGPANGDPNYFVSVNGVNYILPRGKKSLVPAHIAAEIERSDRAQEALDAKKDAMLEAAK